MNCLENKSPEELSCAADGIHYYVRKAAHMTEYFLLAVAISFPLYVYGVMGIWLMILAGSYVWDSRGWMNITSLS